MRSTHQVVFAACLVMSLGATTALAEPVHPDDARTVADRWLDRITAIDGEWGGAQAPRIVAMDPIKLNARDAVLGYAFEIAPSGYVVVSGDTRLAPIRTYSEAGVLRADDHPELADVLAWQLRLDLDRQRSTERRSQTGTVSVSDLWTGLLDSAGGEGGTSSVTNQTVGPLMTTEWSQGPPYNLDCPSATDGTTTSRVVVGCVPLAMSQVMNYHQWPSYGFGERELEFAGSSGCAGPDIPPATLVADYSDSYDWANMPDDCVIGAPVACTPAEMSAAAELCFEMGVAAGVLYGCQETAGGFNMPPNLRYYNRAIRTEDRSSYSDQDWFDLIQDEIDAQRPLYYRIRVPFGQDPEAGTNYAAVCDGWRTQTDIMGTTYWVHMNFGWGGLFNGWYRIDDMLSVTPDHEQLKANLQPNYIYHQDLSDRENDGSDYRVLARFEMPGNPISSTLKLTYYTEPIGGGTESGPFLVSFTSTGGPDEYEAFIPEQSAGTRVTYWISGSANPPAGGIGQPPVAYSYPLEQPDTRIGFDVYDDVTPPTIVHETITDTGAQDWPPTVNATVSDNYGVASVEVTWAVDGVTQTPFPLTEGSFSQWSGAFTGSVSGGESITYRIRATDTSYNGNEAALPPLTLDPFTFDVLDGTVMSFENGFEDWTHYALDVSYTDEWHISIEAPPLPDGGDQSARFGAYDPDDGYAELSNGALESPSFIVGSGAHVEFEHYMRAAQLVSSRPKAYDGGILEITTDDGASWTQLTPVGGYDQQIGTGSDNPLGAGTWCWTGQYSDWESGRIDIDASYVGETASIRFRFGSDSSNDSAVFYEGWYLDSVHIDPGTGSAREAAEPVVSVIVPTGLVGASPNPFNPRTRIAFVMADRSDRVTLEVLDVSGRRVRLLHDGPLNAGTHTRVWDGTAVSGVRQASGVYFVQLRSGDHRSVSRLVMLK